MSGQTKIYGDTSDPKLTGERLATAFVETLTQAGASDSTKGMLHLGHLSGVQVISFDLEDLRQGPVEPNDAVSASVCLPAILVSSDTSERQLGILSFLASGEPLAKTLGWVATV